MKSFMARALQGARSGMCAGHGGPFGASIVKGRRVIASACNTVLKNQDPTAHAEINVIRIASRKLRNFSLKGSALYSTTEPCPMCFAAIHWARIGRVIYGTSIRDVRKRGFNELVISARKIKKMGKSPVKITSGFMKKECLELLRDWDRLEIKKVY